MKKRTLGAVVALLTTAGLTASAVGPGLVESAAAANAGDRKYTVVLKGSNELPTADPDGTGIGTVQVKAKQVLVCVKLTKIANIAAATKAHIHQASVGVNGPIVVMLNPPVQKGKKYQQSKTCTHSSLAIIAGLQNNPRGFYLNVHNAAFPGGAIRGQLAPGGTPPPPPPSTPSSMAALGDSITAGFDVCGAFATCPAGSWSTGTTVNSHYRRILAGNSAISGHAFNYGVPGAPMASLLGQVNSAVAQGVQYVTILMGGNDICKSTEDQMTPVATFESQFQTAMSSLTTGLPNAKILVASVPDLIRIWSINKDNPAAPPAWAGFPICASVFANPTSEDQADVDRRDRVHQRTMEFNAVLESVCATYANCKWDNNAVFSHLWTPSEITTVDYIHPNAAGQESLAGITNAAGYNW